jgi:hypothetical protein
MGYLCRICAENPAQSVASPWRLGTLLVPVSLRIHARPVFAIFLIGVGTVAVVLLLSALAWSAVRTILLLLSPHI